jgi:SAM-dependent methyltransferase
MQARLLAAALLICGTASGQSLEFDTRFEPYEGQPGKDVVWVPTPVVLVDKMLDLASVTPRDFVVDLGSGDGRLVIAAAKRGARAHGVEYEREMVALARHNARQAGVAGRATFVQGDMFEADFSQATVLALFLLPANLRKLAPKFLQMKAGTRIVTNAYKIDDWDEVDTAHADGPCVAWCVAYLYLVPARVAGAWRLPAGEVRFNQYLQQLSGTLVMPGGKHVPVTGQVKGEYVRFSAGLDIYSGRVQGDTMSGEAIGAFSGRWTARRIDH